jgi:hypothetical protein
MIVFIAHQKLATLSSYKPRCKGNIRIIACEICSIESKKGENMITKVIITVTPNFTNRIILTIGSFSKREGIKIKREIINSILNYLKL